MPAPTLDPNSPIRPDWWSKTIAGTVLGFTLAVALAGLFAWVGPGGVLAPNKYQFVMWMIAPVWLAVVSGCFVFRTGRQAWAWLGGANVLAYAALFLSRGPLP